MPYLEKAFGEPNTGIYDENGTTYVYGLQAQLNEIHKELAAIAEEGLRPVNKEDYNLVTWQLKRIEETVEKIKWNGRIV